LNITAEAETLKDTIAQEVMPFSLKVLLCEEERLGRILKKVRVLFAWVDMCIQIAIIGRLNLFQIIIRDFFWFVANIASNDFGVKRGNTLGLLLAERFLQHKILSLLLGEWI
jgi:hypothetical protein